MNEPENRRKRYCLICHLFKPERCHHCSTCGSCMLGMDHHCPWLATCIGYYNRKYFMLVLFYSLTSLAVVIGFNVHKAIGVGRVLSATMVGSSARNGLDVQRGPGPRSLDVRRLRGALLHDPQLHPLPLQTGPPEQHDAREDGLRALQTAGRCRGETISTTLAGSGTGKACSARRSGSGRCRSSRDCPPTASSG